MSKNAIIYCRVSTEEQAREGFSLDAQEKFCRNYAKQNDLRVVATFRDEGKSGTSLDRPALKDLLGRCQQDKNIDFVLVQETDRLARNTKDHLTIKAIFKKADVKLISVAQPMLDESPEGNMIDTILASVNQFQSEISGRKIKKGLQQRFDEGWFPGWAPLGYMNVTIEDNNSGQKAKRIIKEDPERWTILKGGFELYLTGNYSADALGDIFYEKGLRSKTGKKVPHSVMNRTLKNPFYAGIMKWRGLEKMGKHKPMISLQQHKRILHIMDAHNFHACRRRKHSFSLRGFIFCNICGQRFTAEKHPKKNKEYYHCAAMRKHSNRGQNIEVSILEKQIEAYFEKIQFSQDFIDKVAAILKKLYIQQKDEIKKARQGILNQQMSLERKRGIIEEKLLNGVISDEDFIRLRKKFKVEIDQTQNKMADFDSQREYNIDIIEEVLKLTRNINKAYQQATPELKRYYLNIFWEKFLIQDKKIVEAIPTKAVSLLLKKQKVIISTNLSRSPTVIITFKKLLKDWEYLADLKEKLNALKAYQRSARPAA
jgi:DNA invertase Pin-like site-specific DNA recombinase